MVQKEWNIEEEDKTLFQAAIAFGDWLINHPIISEQQKVMIKKVQEVLGKVPEYISDFSGGYGCRALPATEEATGAVRSWVVEIDAEGLLIGSFYDSLPEVDFREDYERETEYQLEYDGIRIESCSEEWIKEVENVERYLCKDFYLQIETELHDETICSDKVLLNEKIISESDLPH